MSNSDASKVRPPAASVPLRRKWLSWAGAAVMTFLFLLVALYLGRNHFLKSYIQDEIKSETGLKTSIAAVHNNFAGSEVVVTGLRLHNPPGYGSPILLDAPKLVVQMDAGRLSRGELHFRHIDFHLAELNIVRSTNGSLNIEHLTDKTRKNKHKTIGALFSRFFKSLHKGSGDQFAGIDELIVRIDKVAYVDLGRPKHNKQFNLGITGERVENIETEAELNTWLASFMVRTALQEVFKSSQRKRAATD